MADIDKPDLGALFGAGEVSTFLGLPEGDLADLPTSPCASAALVGVPVATPYGGVGAYARNAPGALRRAAQSLAANLDRHNFDLGGPTFPEGTNHAVDCGDLALSDSDFAANRARIREAVAQILTARAVPLVIGGDDSIPIPMLDALADTGRTYTILQIDAHIDWRQEHMGETQGLSSTMRRASEMAHIERIVQVGARGIGSAHSDDFRDALDWGAEFHTAQDVHRKGTDPVIETLDESSDIIICLDVDALDPALVPGVIGRSPGGLSYYQVLDLIQGAAQRGRIAAIDVVEYVPEADVDGIGAINVSRLIAAMLGILARQQARLG